MVFCSLINLIRIERFALHIRGAAQTGTQVELSTDTHITLDACADFFAIRPPGLVVIVSACWGGYPSILQALRAKEGAEATLVVAPLVEIHPDDINGVQVAIIAAMVHDDRFDTTIEGITSEHDAKLREKYAEPVIRIVRRDGTMVPAEGKEGLAAPMEDSASYRIVALHRLPAPNNEPPGVAVLMAPDGSYWLTNVPSISDAESDEAVYALQGTVVTFRGKQLRYNKDVALGEFVEIVLEPEPAKVKAFPMPQPPRAHSTEPTMAKTKDAARKIEEVSLKGCKRCN